MADHKRVILLEYNADPFHPGSSCGGVWINLTAVVSSSSCFFVLFFVFQMFVSVSSHTVVDSDEPRSDEMAHWHISWAPSLPLIKILSL